jgi:hypothetical protein
MAYTTADKVRDLLPELLIQEQDLGILDSGTFITLNNSAYAVPTIAKDSTTLVTTTDYTFTQPRKITLSVAASGENFIATTHIAFSDTKIEEFIGQSDRIIDNQFANQSTPDSEYLDDWSQWLTASKIIMLTAKGSEELIAWSKEFESMAMDKIEEYKAGTLKGTNTYTAADRYDKSPVGNLSLDQGTTPSYPL